MEDGRLTNILKKSPFYLVNLLLAANSPPLFSDLSFSIFNIVSPQHNGSYIMTNKRIRIALRLLKMQFKFHLIQVFKINIPVTFKHLVL